MFSSHSLILLILATSHLHGYGYFLPHFIPSHSDALGLLKFLGVQPFDDRAWWRHTFELPLTAAGVDSSAGISPSLASRRLVCLLRGLLWRHSKEAVQDQLRLPTQHTVHHCSELSAIERYWYNEQVREPCESCVEWRRAEWFCVTLFPR